MSQEQKQNIFYVILNVDLMVGNVIQIKSRIQNIVGVTVGTLVHVLVKLIDILKVLLMNVKILYA